MADKPETPEPTGPGGMSLRDWFAGQAMAAIIGHPGWGGTAHEIALESYKAADGMMKARVLKNA